MTTEIHCVVLKAYLNKMPSPSHAGMRYKTGVPKLNQSAKFSPQSENSEQGAHSKGELPLPDACQVVTPPMALGKGSEKNCQSFDIATPQQLSLHEQMEAIQKEKSLVFRSYMDEGNEGKLTIATLHEELNEKIALLTRSCAKPTTRSTGSATCACGTE